MNHKPVEAEFAEHARSELEHAVAAAQRITQLDGSPDMSPARLADRSHPEYRTFDYGDLVGKLKDNLIAERVVTQTYQEIIRWLGDGDPTTRCSLERTLGEEERHAGDLSGLLGAQAES